MTHYDKVQHLIAELAKHGIRPMSVVPPIYGWLWRIGVLVPPPHCQSGASLGVLTSACFAAMFLGLTLLWQWRSPELPGGVLWALPLTAGVFFGLLLTAAYKYAAALLNLPAWKDYPRTGAIAGDRSTSPWIKCDGWVRLLFAAAVVSILAAIVAGFP